MSHLNFKWIAQVLPNLTAVDQIYYAQYHGTGKNMIVCIPTLRGKYPDWMTWERKFGCVNYTPESVEHVYHLKDMGFVYNEEKPMVDVYIGIGTVVTIFGVPGKYMKVYNDRSYVPGVQCGFMYEISDYF